MQLASSARAPPSSRSPRVGGDFGLPTNFPLGALPPATPELRHKRILTAAANIRTRGELSGEERSDEAGQLVGKRAGSAAAVAQEGAKRRP